MSNPEGLPTLHQGDEGVALITLCRPSVLNRLHVQDLHTLIQHFEAVAQSPARALVITGQGRAFCAGFNIEELSAEGDGPQLFERAVQALQALPLPTLARLNGSVYGGATDLALACDFRVGVKGMELRMPAARLGLHYYASGLQRYVSRLGLQAAKRLFLLAEPVDSAGLMRIGYLDACVAAEDLDAEVMRFALALAANAPLAVCGMKQSLNEIAVGTAQPELLREREARCAASEDLREGLAAFAARRPPHFKGR